MSFVLHCFSDRICQICQYLNCETLLAAIVFLWYRIPSLDHVQAQDAMILETYSRVYLKTLLPSHAPRVLAISYFHFLHFQAAATIVNECVGEIPPA